MILPGLTMVAVTHRPDGDGSHRSLYALDWSEKDAIVPPDGPGELPARWRRYLDDQHFALTTAHRAEVHRCFAMAQAERDLYRPFDTAVRDKLFSISRAYLDCALWLVADGCTAPSEDADRFFLHPLMLYRVWQFQTGVGLPWFFAGLDRLDWQLRSGGDGVTGLSRFLSDLRDHDDLLRTLHDLRSSGVG
jgi:hypothetical protein